MAALHVEAELRRVRTGDVGRRSRERLRWQPIVEIETRRRAIRHAGDRAGKPRLLRDGNAARRQRPLRRARTDLIRIEQDRVGTRAGSHAEFEQQLVGRRIRPLRRGQLRVPGRDARGFRRRVEHLEHPVRVNLVLIGVPRRELLLVGDRPRHAAVVVVGVSAGERLAGRIARARDRGVVRRVEPRGQVVLIGEIARRRVEPQLVLLDRTAERAVDVVELLERGRRAREAARVEVGRDIRALKTRTGAVGQERAAEAVAAGPRNRVHDDAVGAGVRHLARQLHVDFVEEQRREAHVRQVRADVHVPDAHAVDQRDTVPWEAAVGADLSAGLIAKHAADVGVRRLDRGHERRHLDPRATRRQFLERLRRHGARLRGCLDVDNRRFAGHGDRLGDGADFHVAVHLRRDAD